LKCQYCGSDVPLPFKCPFCGKYFCAEHRLPELHKCQGIKMESSTYSSSLKESISGGVKAPRIRGGFRLNFKALGEFSSFTEIVHLSIGVLLVMLVGLSIAVGGGFSVNLSLVFWLTLVFASAFIPHELFHKIVAKTYGLWAEFRLTLLGVMITLISILSPIKIVSPGTVIIAGEVDRRMIGKISLSGPLTNLVLSTIFLALSFVTNAFLLKVAFMWGSVINAFVALFNLIPFGFLDGAKVLWWNKYVWALTFITSLLLTITTLIIFNQ